MRHIYQSENFASIFGKIALTEKNLSSNFVNKPISQPLQSVIITVPTPIPLNLPKNNSVMAQAVIRSTASVIILNFVRSIEYFSLTPLTKKSITCGGMYVLKNNATENEVSTIPPAKRSIRAHNAMLPGGVMLSLNSGTTARQASRT